MAIQPLLCLTLHKQCLPTLEEVKSTNLPSIIYPWLFLSYLLCARLLSVNGEWGTVSSLMELTLKGNKREREPKQMTIMQMELEGMPPRQGFKLHAPPQNLHVDGLSHRTSECNLV